MRIDLQCGSRVSVPKLSLKNCQRHRGISQLGCQTVSKRVKSYVPRGHAEGMEHGFEAAPHDVFPRAWSGSTAIRKQPAMFVWFPDMVAVIGVPEVMENVPVVSHPLSQFVYQVVLRKRPRTPNGEVYWNVVERLLR